MHRRMTTIPALLLLLGSCQVETPAARDTAEPVASPAAQNASAQTPIAEPEDRIMQKQCGGTEFRLIVEGTTGTLHMTTPAGKTIEIAKPDELSDYTAVGLGCAISPKDNRPYFVVQYGELPYGCGFCEWYYLYDVQGKQLTRSLPLLLKDRTLPEGQTQYANNREFEALLEKLGMEPPEIAFVE